MRDKIELTSTIINQLPKDQSITVADAAVAWWYNLRTDGGLRLTDEGYNVLVKFLELECYNYSIKESDNVNNKMLLLLDKKLTMPYYITKKKSIITMISFFSSKEAVLINLYGDLEKFLNNY